MVTPILLTDPFKTTWYHGSNAKPFTDWLCPPPPPSPADVSHTGLFFTADEDFAKGAGKNVCTIKLSEDTKFIVPAQGDARSTAFRQTVFNSNPLAANCKWLDNDAVWAAAWSTGEVLRFSYDAGDPKAVLAVSKALASVVGNLKKIIRGSVPEKVVIDQAMTCLTRGWIEQLVLEAKRLGYQAIQGAEIDRWSATSSTPLAQSWLAVMDKSVISAPTWL